MPKSKLKQLKHELEAAEKDVQFKETQLSDLKEQVSRARLRVEELEGEVQSNVALEDDVQALLYHQQQTAAAFKDYENRVLALELQGLVERWRAMDVEELAQQNHELREECMRLHRENMELSRSVAEGSLHARRDLAKIELALEMTVKEKMQEMHAKLRRELYDEMDDKTKVMVHNHGALQDHMQLLAGQAATLDRQYRALQADRARYKVDADVAASLGEQQAAQSVELRRQLKQAYTAIELLRRKLAESEARAEAAWDEAMRAGSRAAAAAARAASAAAAGQHGGAGGGGTGLEGDGDSAYGMAGGEGAEVAALEVQLRHARQRFERMRLQRDRWRERSLLYERACAQLQAALQTLQDQARLSLPGGVKQDLDAIWCAAKASPDPETGLVAGAGAGAGVGAMSPAASRPGTARSGHSGSPRVGGSGDWGAAVTAAGGKAWAAGGGAAAAGAARMRASSARPAAVTAAAGPGPTHGAGVGLSLGGLPARPQTAVDPTTAARRAAEQIRRSVNAPPGSRPASAFPGHGQGNGAKGQGAGGGREAYEEELVYEEGVEEDDDEPLEPPGATAAAAAAAATAAAAAGSAGGGVGVDGRSVSPPGRVPVSRLYSEAAEPLKTTWQPGYQPVADLRPLSPPARGPPAFGTSTALVTSTSGMGASAAGPLSSMGLPARTPGSVRPHSALPAGSRAEPQAPPQPRWAPGQSLTGLTSSSAPPADTAAAGAAAPGPEPSLQASIQQQQQQQQGGVRGASGAHSPTPSPPRLRPPLGSAGEAAGAEWQAWQDQRQRSQSPQYAEIARNTGGNLPASVATAAASSAAPTLSAAAGAAGARPPAPLPQQQPAGSLGPGVVPPVSVGGGAIYTVAHAASKAVAPGFVDVSAAAGAGALTAGGLLPPSAAAAVSASQAAAAQYLQTYGGGSPASASVAAAVGAAGISGSSSSRGAPAGTPGGPGAALTNPSTMLSALRRPPSAAQKLSSADVMFAGSRPNSARSQSGSAGASARGPAASRGSSLSGLGGSGLVR